MSRSGEQPFQHAPAHLAGVVIELHLQMLGLDARTSAPALLRVPAPQGPVVLPQISHEPNIASGSASLRGRAGT